MSATWKSVREDLQAGRHLSIRFGRAANHGVATAEVYHDDLPMPLCVVWFSFFGRQGIEILNSFVFEQVRRCGLRTFAHAEMLKACPGRYILTGGATKSGEAWMKATGYRRTKQGWEFRP